MRPPSEPGCPEDPPALDGDSAERLATGHTAPDDAPPGYEGVASLLHSVASAAGPEPRGEAATVAAMAAVLSPATPTSLDTRRRQSMISKLVPAKVAAVAVGALLSTGAAAAAGALPDPVQSALSDALGAVGLQVPDGSGSGSDPLDALDTTTTTLDDTTTTTLDDTTTTTLDDTTTTTLDDTTPPTTPDACASAGNHGQFVSGVARSTPRGPGHGAVVSEAAQSDCGRHGGDDGDETDEDGENRGPGGGADTSSNRGPGNGNGNGNGHGNGGPGNGNGHGNGNGNSGPGNSGSSGRGGRG